MRRRLFTILSVLSLLMCVATVVLWVRSYWLSDTYGISRLSGLSTDTGEFLILFAEPNWNFYFERGYHREDLTAKDEPWNPRRVARHTWNVLLAHGEEFPGLHIIAVRFWGTLVIAAYPLAHMLAQYARCRRRIARGSCPTCGYDLRASKEQCPECGAACR